jgi:hypothetical protein
MANVPEEIKKMHPESHPLSSREGRGEGERAVKKPVEDFHPHADCSQLLSYGE